MTKSVSRRLLLIQPLFDNPDLDRNKGTIPPLGLAYIAAYTPTTGRSRSSTSRSSDFDPRWLYITNLFGTQREERDSGERIVLLSHNGHVAKATRQIPDSRFLQPFVPLGARLAAELERDYVAVGFCCGYGEVREGIQPVTLPTVAADSLDARLAALGGPRLYLRLRDIPECPGSQWLHQPCAIRYELTVEWCRPREAFDAVIFLESVSATQPIASALARLGAVPIQGTARHSSDRVD